MADVAAALSRVLKAELKARGWSARELGRQAALSPPYASDLVEGRADPSLSVLCRLADALEVSLDVLAGRAKKGR